jgi:hypothetical protein
MECTDAVNSKALGCSGALGSHVAMLQLFWRPRASRVEFAVISIYGDNKQKFVELTRPLDSP